MNLYVYCLADPATARAVAGAQGLGGGEVGVLVRGGLAAVVSEFDGSAVGVTRENVLAHERVVESVLAVETPLPFRFGTVVGGERLRSYLDSQVASLAARLAWVRGCVEMSVKVIAVPEGSPRETERRDAQRPGALPGAGPGAAFLLAKRREILGDEAARARAEEIAGWLARRLDGAARESRVAVRPQSSLAVSAAHLVERARLGEYRERLRAARGERAGLRFLTSGAWPPYSFVESRLERGVGSE